MPWPKRWPVEARASPCQRPDVARTPYGVSRIDVETAAELASEVRRLWPESDALWMAAAVADFRPDRPREVKLSKRAGAPEIRWVPTEDVLRSAGKAKKPRQVLIGFAAETGAPPPRRARSCREKNLDFIVANDVSKPGVGFDHETNAVTLIGRRGDPVPLGLASKAEIADRLVDLVHGGSRGGGNETRASSARSARAAGSARPASRRPRSGGSPGADGSRGSPPAADGGADVRASPSQPPGAGDDGGDPMSREHDPSRSVRAELAEHLRALRDLGRHGDPRS
jgi:hypothetical protein